MRSLRVCFFIGLFASGASAQPHIFNARETGTAPTCKFEIPKTLDALSCDNDLDRGVSSLCTVKFINNGTAACSGHFAGYVGPATQGSVDQASTTGITTTCRAVGLTPLPAPPAQFFGVSVLETAELCEGDGSVAPGASITMTARITPALTFGTGRFTVGVTDTFANAANEVVAQFDLAACNLSVSGPSVSQSGIPYSLTWTTAFAPTTYEVQEATKTDFSDAGTSTTSSLSQQFTHTATGSAATYYYRVRAGTCRGAQGPYSVTATVTVAPAPDATSKTFDVVVPQGSTTVVVQQVHIDGLTPNVPYSATVDQTYLTVTPATGTVGADGSVNLTVRANPTSLPVGANTGTVTVTTARPKSAGRIVSLDNNTASVPISVSVASPVTQAPKTPPPSTTWIVPAVAHRDGIGAQFISDVRLANTSSASASYQLTYTAANSDGSKNGRATKIDLAPGQTAALNDILRDLFGLATTTADASGVLEIRTLTSNPSPGTFAASRTYSVATAGTYGQFVPSVPISSVAIAAAAGGIAQPLILGHVGQTSAQRMNVGIVESLGFPTSGHIKAFSATGELLADQAFTLRPFEQQQINSFLARNALNVFSARIDVVVDSPATGTTSGGVTAYASMLDNSTQDASVLSGVKAASLVSRRFTLPGVAEGTSIGEHSEMRILNAGTAAANATVTFYPRNGNPVSQSVSLASGEIKNFSNVVSSLFGMSAADGSVVVTTPSDAQLLVTGRTFSSAPTGGTYGRLQTALTAADGAGTGDPDLQVLQLEESDKFHSDLGMVELTGAPVKVHVTLYATGDSKVSAATDFDLNANEFRSDQSIMRSLGAGTASNAYNGRLAIKVLSGSGRVAAFGLLVDKTTNDPTLLPAQK